MDWFPAILAIIGKIFIAHRHRAGLLFEVAANVGFLILAIHLRLWGILCLSATSIVVYLWGFKKWQQ